MNERFGSPRLVGAGALSSRTLVRCAAAVALTAFATLLFASRGNAAAFPGENGPIAFQSNRDGNWEIYTMRSDGSDETRLTNNSAYDGQPAISPNGRQIVFISDRDTSPDSSANPASRLGTLWIMNSDGSDQRRLTNRRVKTPAFSPDGKRVTFSSLSSDGCAFGVSYEKIYIMSTVGADGGANFNVSNECATSSNPTFSPDGNIILFQGTSYGSTPAGRDAVMWIEANARQAFPHTVITLDPHPNIGAYGEMKGFSLSSNGSRVAYSLRIRGGGPLSTWGEPRIYLGRAGGSCVHCGRDWSPAACGVCKLTKDDDVRPSYAPEANWVAFERKPDAGTDIYKVGTQYDPLEGPQDPTRLTTIGKNMAVDWGPRTP